MTTICSIIVMILIRRIQIYEFYNTAPRYLTCKLVRHKNKYILLIS